MLAISLVGAIGLLVNVGLVWPSAAAVVRAVSNKQRYQQHGESSLYEDKDGKATEDSQRAFSNSRIQSGLLNICSLAGLALSLTIAISSTIKLSSSPSSGGSHIFFLDVEFSLSFQWVLLVAHAIAISIQKNPVQKFNLALLNATSSLLLILLSLVLLQAKGWKDYALPAVTIAVASVSVVTSCTFPRRPDVYHDGRIVDRIQSVSLFDYLNFNWQSSLLSQSAQRGFLIQDDLPTLDHMARSRELYDAFMSSSAKGKLLKLIILSHWPALIRQYVSTTIHVLMMFAPQYCMYRLLQALEARQAGQDVTLLAVSWTFILGFTLFFDSTVASIMWFTGYNFISVPLRVQLSALIFGKAMRRKDVKGGNKESNNDEVSENGQRKPDCEEENALQNTRQGTINLVGVDTFRVATQSIYQNMVYGAFLGFAAGYTLVFSLVGWIPLAAGLLVQILILPLNIYFATIYTHAEEKVMMIRDNKLAKLNEALTGIRQIKFTALERRWQAKIVEVREKELETQWLAYFADSWLMCLWHAAPVLLSAVVLMIYAIINGSLSPSVAFTIIGTLDILQQVMAWVPELMTKSIDAYISLGRIENYLNSPETLDYLRSPGESVAFEAANISWPTDDKEMEINAFALRDVNIEFPNQELSIIAGPTGSGKSLLLASVLGEVDLLSGKVQVPLSPSVEERYDRGANKDNWILPTAISFVSQQPWIENCTFRENVLFGLPYDETRYQEVIEACALNKDLEILTDGDATEIGASGINLSGGQRWRITLARALYSRAGILVMDDIFSAVDAHVGRHIYENALVGSLGQGRTRILVTHHVSLCLPKAKYVVFLNNGRVEWAGSEVDLQKHDSLGKLIHQLESDNVDDDAVIEDDLEELPRAHYPHPRRISSISQSGDRTEQSRTENILRLRRMSTTSGNGNLDQIDEGDHNGTVQKSTPKKFIEDETKSAGRVSMRVYGHYLKAAGGWWAWLIILIAFIAFEVLIAARSWWVAVWTESYATKPDAIPKNRLLSLMTFQQPVMGINNIDIDPELQYYLKVYIAIAVILVALGTIKYFIIYAASINASRKLFNDMLHAILRAPLRWLDTVPVGRVLNRFTADFNSIDAEMGIAYSFGITFGLRIITIILAGTVVSYYLAVIATILLVACGWLAHYYLNGAREVKRLESLAKSPIFDLFGAALSGVSTIRAFGNTKNYIDRMFQRIDQHGRSVWYMWYMNRWLTWRLSIIGNTFAVVMALIVVFVKEISPSMAGFALSFMLQFTETAMWVLRRYADIELGMNAAERILEYTAVPNENQGGADAPAAWPTEGRLEINNLVVSYAPDLPPVLKGLTFSVSPNERIGVVGRTGAGKSSLTLALFRFLEAHVGSIHIDGIDISRIKLEHLRSRLAIIPQDPVLFSGTVRSNLDPFDERTDDELREVLQRVHLLPSSSSLLTLADGMEDEEGLQAEAEAEAEQDINNTKISSGNDDWSTSSNTNRFHSLATPISESGQNLSQGQRQLLCLARAILTRPKLLVLDEATSAVDKATDELIQRSIREEFHNSTMLVIAHRLSTVADFDRILVLGEGKVLEFGSPRELLAKKEGVFADMVQGSGEAHVLKEIIFGEEGKEEE